VNWEQIFIFNPDPRDDGWFIDDVMITDTITEPASVAVDTRDNEDIKQDWDFDGVGATCDCAPDDPDAWLAPLDVTGLSLTDTGGEGGTTTLVWEPAGEPGTIVEYDTLTSVGPESFGSSEATLCIEAADSSDTVSTDMTTPGPHTVRYFLVRASHTCGAALGTRSSGEVRSGIACP